MRRRLLLAGVIAAAIAAGFGPYREYRRAQPWRKLVETVNTNGIRLQRGQGRLALLDAPLRPQGRVYRGGNPRDIESDRQIRAAAAAVIASEATEHQKAIAELLTEQSARAVRRLEAFPVPEMATSHAWSDYAVALLATAEMDESRLFFALAAVDRAIDLDGTSLAARFNRAVILEQMRVRSAAGTAYYSYTKFDETSPWSKEAGRRVSLVQRPQQHVSRAELVEAAMRRDYPRIVRAAMENPESVREWTERDALWRWGKELENGNALQATAMLYLARHVGQSMRTFYGDELLADAVETIVRSSSNADRLRRLAAAHVAYGNAGGRNSKYLDEAERLFRSTGSPMLLNVLYDSARWDKNRAALLRELELQTPPRYRVLRARIDSERVESLRRKGALDEALALSSDVWRELIDLEEYRHAQAMHSHVTSLLTALGRTTDVWGMHAAWLRLATEWSSPKTTQFVLCGAAIDAIREQRWELAHSLLKLVGELESDAHRQAEVMLWSTLAAKRAPGRAVSAAELKNARRAADAILAANQREWLVSSRRLVAALLLGVHDPVRSAGLLDTGATVNPQEMVERARFLDASGRTSDARAVLERAIQLVEQRRDAITDHAFRDSFLGKSANAYDALADLVDSQGDVDGALAVLERRRARVVLDRIESRAPAAQVASTSQVSKLLPPRVTILSYAAFADRLVLLVMTSAGTRRVVIPIGADKLRTKAAAFSRAIQRRDRPQALADGRMLHELLIPSLSGVDTLMIVADGALSGLPFAALVMNDGRYLVERFEIVTAPSVQAYGSRRRQPGTNDLQTVLSVGNPRIDPARHPSLASLAHAEDEARMVGAMYGAKVVLTGAAAKKRRIIDALPGSDVAHFATHGIASPMDASWSRLVLDEALTAGEVAAMDLRRTEVVVLAACQTATEAKGYGYIQSLAAAFVAAGARNVIASSWNIEDEATRRYSVHFHRELLAGRTPAAAHRAAQLQMLRSADAGLRDPRAWAAIRLYGSGD